MPKANPPAASAAPTQPRTYMVVHGVAYYFPPGGAPLMSAPLTIPGVPDFAAGTVVDYVALVDQRAAVAIREIERSLTWLASVGVEASLAP